MIKLGINIDHIATIREARKTYEPDPIAAAGICERAGADGITVHLREDRRHIQDRDLAILKETVNTKLNLEMAAVDSIIKLAMKTKPDQCTLVPEKRQEVTTEGGLNVDSNLSTITNAVKKLQSKNIVVSLFIDPDPKQIIASAKTGAQYIEIHTGAYARARQEEDIAKEIENIICGIDIANDNGLRINAGHGLHYHNVQMLASIPDFEEFNIGHSIISRAVFDGLSQAVKDMKRLLI
ncbi:MAG: pyridoxine 5'-phosphate synthase [Candidatus Ancaeobacter aquaticus]|nr:pyridoxine 5'-phosphate synthase [Candidatus Ancaeobacter aquaticus]